jgi:hypothetical protein
VNKINVKSGGTCSNHQALKDLATRNEDLLVNLALDGVEWLAVRLLLYYRRENTERLDEPQSLLGHFGEGKIYLTPWYRICLLCFCSVY